MLKNLNPWQVRVLSLGPVARQILGSPSAGQVCAVFQHTFYVATKNGLFCVGTENLFDGPLNLIVEVPSSTDWRSSGVRLGQGIVIGGDNLTVGCDLIFPWKDAGFWSPPALEVPNVSNLSTGLKNLRHAIVGRIPAEGFGCFLSSNSHEINGSLMAIQAHATISRIRTVLEMAFQGSQTGKAVALELASLVGLGPGLTPSGDDFIGGMMIGLSAIGCNALATDIWECLKIGFVGKSNFISSAHLEAAAIGIATDKLHDIAGALCLGEDVSEELIVAIDSIGHSSGWDSLAGLVTVLEVSVKSNYLQYGP